jgi:hypothetical protein
LQRFRTFGVSALIAMGCGLLWTATASAQATAPDDTPSISVGANVYMDYTYTVSPQKTDSDGNLYHPSSFNVSRTYINFNGKVSHVISFRITPDINRISSGDLEFRLKYGFMQVNLDDWMTKGSWIRFGQGQTPYIDYEEGIYRYRFQGTTFTEREGYLTSSDVGASFHYSLPNNYGEVHTGIYNGEGYHAPEVSNTPSFQIRATVRPFAHAASPLARGLNVTGFYDADAYLKNDEKKRAIAEVYYEEKNFRAEFTYLDTHDQKSAAAADVHGHGWSIWMTPISNVGWEGLFRYDHMTPNTVLSNQLHKRTIAGIAYWFPHKGGPAAGMLFDYEMVQYPNLGQQDDKKIALQAVVNY